MGLTSCSDDDDEPSDPIVGTWLLQIQEPEGVWNLQFHIMNNGTLEGKSWNTPDESEPKNYEFTGNWSIAGEYLTLSIIETDGEIESETYRYNVDGNKLIIYDYDEPGPNVFYKR